MPKLRMKKNGKYVIRRKPPYGVFESWQIEPKGVDVLKRKGLHIPTTTDEDDFEDISEGLFQELKAQKLVYNNGKGREEYEPVVSLPQNNLLLAFKKKQTIGWDLLLIASIPFDERLRRFFVTKSVNSGFLVKNGIDPLENAYLRSYRDKIFCSVPPRKPPYTIKAYGPWAKEYDTQAWIHDVDGLNPKGTLFNGAGLGGVRLLPGQAVYPGRSYYFVSLGFEPPQELSSCRALGENGRWRAWEISLSETMSEANYDIVSNWCERIGNPLRELPWRLSLLSPPADKYVKNLPLLSLGCKVIVEVSQPTNPVQGAKFVELEVKRNNSTINYTKEQINEQRYLTFPLTQPGEYVIRGHEDQVRPLKFRACGSLPLKITQPAPLAVCVRNDEKVLRFSAFGTISDQSNKHEILLEHFGKDVVPEIAVESPVPIDVNWVCGNQRSGSRGVEARKVAPYLANYVSLALEKHEVFVLCIDAGTFGVVNLRLIPPVSKRKIHAPTLADLSPDVIQRLRWLTTAVIAQASRENMVPLSTPVKRALAKLGEKTGDPSLAKLTYVPQKLLPHVCALAHMVEQG